MISIPNVAGIKLHYMVQQFHPDDERLFPLYEMVIEKKKRLLLHVGTGPVGNEFVGIKRFSNIMKRYPNLPANIAHMDGLEYREFMQILDVYPNLYLFHYVFKMALIQDQLVSRLIADLLCAISDRPSSACSVAAFRKSKTRFAK